jgi:hypothetical protein
MTNEEQVVFVRLEQALREVGDALSRADLDRLLAAEPELGAALETVAHLRPRALDAGLRAAVERGRAALLRCRRLGAALVEFTRITLDPAGESAYSRAGMVPNADRTGMPGAVTPTMEARG